MSRVNFEYVNASELCQVGRKKIDDWFSLESTKDLICILESDTGIPESLLVELKSDQIYIHPDLAIQLTQWISPSFALQVSRWIIKSDTCVLLKNKEKQKQLEYPENSVIYMLTTDEHIKRRTYIIGKAKNLNIRIRTYNKICNHIVVYYRECKSEDDMIVIENLVLTKLKDYRDHTNIDCFILPEDKEVSFFISTIDECINFF